MLLVWEAWRAVEGRFEASSATFVSKLEKIVALWPQERAHAGTVMTCSDHVEPLLWRHLNVFNKEYIIVFALPRGCRSHDGNMYRVTPPWEGRNKYFTQEFGIVAVTFLRKMPMRRADQILCKSHTRMPG